MAFGRSCRIKEYAKASIICLFSSIDGELICLQMDRRGSVVAVGDSMDHDIRGVSATSSKLHPRFGLRSHNFEESGVQKFSTKWNRKL